MLVYFLGYGILYWYTATGFLHLLATSSWCAVVANAAHCCCCCSFYDVRLVKCPHIAYAHLRCCPSYWLWVAKEWQKTYDMVRTRICRCDKNKFFFLLFLCLCRSRCCWCRSLLLCRVKAPRRTSVGWIHSSGGSKYIQRTLHTVSVTKTNTQPTQSVYMYCASPLFISIHSYFLVVSHLCDGGGGGDTRSKKISL